MSAANVELVRRLYEAWNVDGLEPVRAALDREVEVLGHPTLPEPGPIRGREDVIAWLERMLDAWEELSVHVEQVIDAGDRVVALVRLSGRGKGSGVPVRGGLDAHVWTLRDGKVVAGRWYQGTAEALRDVGSQQRRSS
jgi:ketosteroid isomerase-like protein